MSSEVGASKERTQIDLIIRAYLAQYCDNSWTYPLYAVTRCGGELNLFNTFKAARSEQELRGMPIRISNAKKIYKLWCFKIVL